MAEKLIILDAETKSLVESIEAHRKNGREVYCVQFKDGESAWCESKVDIYKAIERKRQGKEIPCDF